MSEGSRSIRLQTQARVHSHAINVTREDCYDTVTITGETEEGRGGE